MAGTQIAGRNAGSARLRRTGSYVAFISFSRASEARTEEHMLSRYRDFDRTFDVLDELRRQMDRVWGDLDDRWGHLPRAQAQSSPAPFPRVNVYDAGANLVIVADVPGIGEKDFELTLDDGVLTLAATQKNEAPQGYTAHRQERFPNGAQLRRSIALPVKVDPEKTTAELKDGVLTITLAKAPESRPRQIAVRARS
jgi:HSP20 family protein